MEKEPDNNAKIVELIAKVLFDSKDEQEMTLFSILIIDLLGYHLNNLEQYKFNNLFKQYLHIDTDITARDSKSLLEAAKVFKQIANIYENMGNHIADVHEKLGKPSCISVLEAINILTIKANIQSSLLPRISDPVQMKARVEKIIESDPELKELNSKSNNEPIKDKIPVDDLDKIEWPDEIDDTQWRDK